MAENLIDRMADATRSDAGRIADLLRTAPDRYRVYSVPKKEPGKTRLIAEPAAELKRLQRWFAAEYLSKLPVHRAATAYRPGSSILRNAAVHRDGAFLLCLDFKDFFPSLRPRDLREAIARDRRLGFSRRELGIVDRLLFWRPAGIAGLSGLRLSAGAPSSPAVSNAVMTALDERIAGLCRPRRVRYTRYADDLTFSAAGREPLLAMFAAVVKLIDRTRSPRLTINDEKTRLASKSERREVTGLTLTADGGLSIGRERKADIRDQIARFRRGALPAPERRRLSGLLAFAAGIEPGFVDGLTRKHGADLIARIRSGHK